MDPEIVAAFVIAAGAILAAVITVAGSTVKSHENRFFPARSNSDDLWIRDMAKSKSITFLGTSHTHLFTYLNQLHASIEGQSELDHIEIYYASDETGKVHENNNFFPSVRQSRQDIAALVCQPEWQIKFPHFDAVHFKQTTQAISFSGSIIKNKKNKLPVVYVIHHPYRGHFDADELLTFRYASFLPAIFSERQRELISVYLASYDKVSNTAQSLGNFSQSLWDISVKQWARFSQECTAHIQSMEKLVDIAEIDGADEVLDLACGTGHVSKLIKDKYPSASMTVLDGSPRMIEAAKTVLGDQVRYVLCRIPLGTKQCDIDILTSFDVILIHLSLPAAAETNDQLIELAEWCRHHVSEHGRIVVAVHNTAVDIGSLYSKESDPLRKALEEEVGRMGLSNIYRKIDKKSFQPDQIEKAFLEHGFDCSCKATEKYEMKMKHRLLMWSCPVVINDILDILDVQRVTDDQIDRLLSNVETTVGGVQTPDMEVMFWRFDSA